MSESGSKGPSMDTWELAFRMEVARDTWLLDFMISNADVPYPEPGQFFHVDCKGGKEHLLRRPISVHGASRKDGVMIVRMLVEVVGWGTERLCSLPVGEKVGMMGPLGRGFNPIGVGKALLVAGGMGVAPLCYLANELEKSELNYDFIAGFGSRESYYRGIEELGGGVTVFTEDGGVGEKGLASEGAKKKLESGEYTAVYTCGPEGMISTVARLSEGKGIPCQVSLDSRMACGLGACRGCVKEARDGGKLRVCTDGPVFDSRMVLLEK